MGRKSVISPLSGLCSMLFLIILVIYFLIKVVRNGNPVAHWMIFGGAGCTVTVHMQKSVQLFYNKLGSR